jgi:hypothetical protein
MNALAADLTAAGVEATFLLDAARVQQIAAARPDLERALRRQNVGYLAQAGGRPPLAGLLGRSWSEGVRTFLETETKGYNAACWMGAALPAAAAMRGWAAPPFAVMAEWGVRVVLGAACPVGGYDRPFFYCGRLHLTGLGPNAIDVPPEAWRESGENERFASRVRRRADLLAAPGGVVQLRCPLDKVVRSFDEVSNAAAWFRSLLERLRTSPNVALHSARQVVDRFADISYDLAVPADVFRRGCCWVWSGDLRPFYYEQGFLSPAELLYGLAKIWSESIRKGKPVRNTNLKSPLGPPEPATTDAAVKGLVADEIPQILDALVQTVENTGQLPASVDARSGRVAVQDLLPTLADGVNPNLAPADVELRRGRLDESRVQPWRIRRCLDDAGLPADSDVSTLETHAKLQLWTYKPVVGLTG